MLRSIKAQLADAEVHPALEMAKQAYLSYEEGLTDGEHLMLAWSFVKHKYVKMILETLEGSAISPETLPILNGRDISLRTPIASLFRTVVVTQSWRMPVWRKTLLLVGLTLSEKDVSDSWPNFEGITNCRAPHRLILAKLWLCGGCI